MNPNPEQRNDWLANKIPGAKPAKPSYEFEARAKEVLRHWMVGYDEVEIAAFLSSCDYPQTTEFDVARDLQYMQKNMSPRQVIAMQNDRARIKIYRAQGTNYETLLNQALGKNIEGWFAAGLSPVPALKEFRQAVGLEEKPGGINVSVTKQSATFISNPGGSVPPENLGHNGKIRSPEDLIRMIIQCDPTCGLQAVTDIEAQEALPAALPEDAPEEGDADQGETSGDTEDNS